MPVKMNQRDAILRTKTPEKKVIGKKGTMVLTKNDKAKSSTIGKIVKSTEKLAEVRVGIGSTLNMGNYESLRLGVDISLPCTEESLGSTFDRALVFAEKKLSKMIRQFKPTAAPPVQANIPNKRSAQDVLDDGDIDEIVDDDEEVDL